MTKPVPTSEPLPAELAEARTQHGRTLQDLSGEGGGVLLVFLRHAGCPFCREAASDLQTKRSAIEEAGLTLVLVHQGEEEAGASFFGKFDLGDVHRVADPERRLFRAVDLARGNLWQIGGPKVMVRSLLAALRGHVPGRVEGDAFQMPGSFVVRDGTIVLAYRHKSQADRPRYDEMACSV